MKTINRNEVLVGEKAHLTAKKMARFGHTNWVVWCDKNGTKKAARVKIDSLRAAMLATGTQGRFVIYQASDGAGSVITWSLACLLLKNLKYWERNPEQKPRWLA